MNRFVVFLRQLLQLTQEEMDIILSYTVSTRYKKGSTIFRAGSICRKIRFITEGITRTYLIEKDQDITWSFQFPNDILIDLHSATHHTPATLHAEALSDVTCVECGYEDWLKIYELVPKTEKLGRITTENYFFKIQNLLLDNQTKDLKARYLALMENNAELLLSVPQKHIATYLGVQPESLSRIKRQIKH